MVEYGFMEGQYLQSRFIEPIRKITYDEDGNEHVDEITIEQQIAELSPEWKPVDMISEEALQSRDDNYIIVPVPYDAGDHITYRYERRFDRQKIKGEIETLKSALTESDYKITKCYEASLLRQSLPYDIETLHMERQGQRDRINELEALLL